MEVCRFIFERELGDRFPADQVEDSLPDVPTGWSQDGGRYYLVIPQVHAQSALLAPLFEVSDDAAFREAVAALPGYDVGPMGRMIAEV